MRWPWSRRTADPLIERLIVPPVVKYAVHNEALEQRSRARREAEAQAIAEVKRQLAETAPRIRLVHR